MVIMNNATIHILVQVSAEAYIFIYLGTAWSYGHAMFNGLRNCQAVFQSSYAILHSQFLHFLASTFSYLLIPAFLVSVKWYLFKTTIRSIFSCAIFLAEMDIQMRCFAPYTHTLTTYKSLIRKIICKYFPPFCGLLHILNIPV